MSAGRGKARVVFSAGGYGTSVELHAGRGAAEDAVVREAAEMAADHGLGAENISRFGDEWVLQSDSGEEIARWEVLP